MARHFLSRGLQSALDGAGNLVGWPRGCKAQPARPRFLSASATVGAPGAETGLNFAAVALDENGKPILNCSLPMRAHEMALHPATQRCLAVGRQPGHLCTMIDLTTGRKLFDLTVEDGYAFNGHAVFLGDGERIVSAEQELSTSRGRLTFYDSDSGMLLDTWSSHGLEPHEVILDPSNDRLIVANGGIVDRNAVGEVDSSLVIIALQDGAVIARATLPEELLSLSMRHMALTGGNDVVFGMQDQDPQSDLRPLVGLLDSTGGIRFLDIPRNVAMTLRGYIGSVAVDSSGWIACATSPKGNLAMFWDLRHETYLGEVRIADGCGVSPANGAGGFIVTGGKGDVIEVATLDENDMSMAPIGRPLIRDARWQWDNHLTRIPA